MFVNNLRMFSCKLVIHIYMYSAWCAYTCSGLGGTIFFIVQPKGSIIRHNLFLLVIGGAASVSSKPPVLTGTDSRKLHPQLPERPNTVSLPIQSVQGIEGDFLTGSCLYIFRTPDHMLTALLASVRSMHIMCYYF